MKVKRNEKGQFVKRFSGELFEGHKIWYQKGYACAYINKHEVKIHVYVWERANGLKPVGFEVHHIDHDKGNYELSNLELLSNSDHQRTHAGWVKEGGVWIAKPCSKCQAILPLSSFYPRKGWTPSANCRRCHNSVIIERQQLPANREKLRLYKQKYYQDHKNKEVTPHA